MLIHEDLNPPRVDFQQLRTRLGDAGWGTTEFCADAVLEKMIKGCSYLVVVHETDTFLGYARAFADDIAVTSIAEILLHPKRRRQGIGTRIMNELLRVTSHTSIYVEAFAGTEGFFESFSITKRSKLAACSRKWLTT